MDEDHKNEAEVFTRRKDSSSSSGSSQELIFPPNNVLKHQGYSSSPPIDPQCFSFISSSPEDSFRQSPAGYDPSRIPSSIFSSKPANPMEWSVASNESLFSIQIGNNSFTRDNVFMYKSGELTRAEDHQGKAQGNQLPPVEETETVATELGEIKEESLGVSGALVDVLKADSGGREAVGEHEVKNVTLNMVPYNSPMTSISRGSDGTGSNHSTRSFAFPVLAPSSASEYGRSYYCSGKVGSGKQDVQRQRKSQEVPPKRSTEEEKVKPKASRRWFSCPHCCRSRFFHNYIKKKYFSCMNCTLKMQS